MLVEFCTVKINFCFNSLKVSLPTINLVFAKNVFSRSFLLWCCFCLLLFFSLYLYELSLIPQYHDDALNPIVINNSIISTLKKSFLLEGLNHKMNLVYKELHFQWFRIIWLWPLLYLWLFIGAFSNNDSWLERYKLLPKQI